MATDHDDQTGLAGQVITETRPLTDDESIEVFGEPTYGSGIVIVLANGTRLIPSRDPEGNGPGALFGLDDEGAFQVRSTIEEVPG